MRNFHHMTNINSSGRHLVLATDGACLRNPGPGGWAVIVHELEGETIVSRSALAGRANGTTTNNRSELKGAIEALRFAKASSYPVITIVSDSRYVTDGATEYLSGWKARGWRKSDGKPIKNQDLWMRLDELMEGLEVRWGWTEGHNGHPMNEMADLIASDAAAGVHSGDPAELQRLYPEAFSL